MDYGFALRFRSESTLFLVTFSLPFWKINLNYSHGFMNKGINLTYLFAQLYAASNKKQLAIPGL
jgi:hypothetical protein